MSSRFTANTNHGNFRGAQLLGADLYRNLEKYLTNHLTNLKLESERYSDESLIAFYNKSWDRYTVGARYLNHIFDYLNRHWVKRERDEGKKDIYEVNTLCLLRWKLDLFDGIETRLINAILLQIEKQRNGEAITNVNIKTIVQSFVSLGLDESNQKKTNLTIYKTSFEKPFLTATSDYYTTESKQFLQSHSVVDYMKKVLVRLKDEMGRVQMYLHPSTEVPLMDTCDEILISNHVEAIQGEFLNLLSQDREDDYHRMYTILSRIKEGLDPIKTMFQDYVTRQGLEAIDKLVAENENNPKSIDPKAYVDALLSVHAKYTDIVKRAFENNSSIVKSLDTGCTQYINSNSIAKLANSKSKDSKTPELLARYSDALLKKSSKNSEELDSIDDHLNGIMKLFQYVDEKDSFEKFYARLFARRLVYGQSVSLDYETSMVLKLKEACGFEYTNKLQRMFQDMTTSEEMQVEFKRTAGESIVDFQPLVLAESFWPLPHNKLQFNLPKELNGTFERFQGFYSKKHTGRKLKWLWNFSKGELKVNFATSSKVGYTFQVSAYQMAILLSYNNQDEYTFAQLEELTGLPPNLLSNSLIILVKARVLLQDGATPSREDENFTPETKFSLNAGFKNKKIRINLNLPLRTEQKQDIEEVQKTIEEDRKMFLQAVIVRIMKTRKELKHVSLVQETIEQSKKRFNPKVPDIKKCIDSLIDKEYLERLEGNKYRYLA